VAEAVRERESECTVCRPGEILACIHFSELVLWLADNSDKASPPQPGHCASDDWWVYGPQQPHLCQCGGCSDHLVMSCSWADDRFESLPAAQAEFARRAELLRLGGGDG
jgi:hypothetical protein